MRLVLLMFSLTACSQEYAVDDEQNAALDELRLAVAQLQQKTATNGLAGPVGPQGVAGPQGEQGPQGNDGIDGTPGPGTRTTYKGTLDASGTATISVPSSNTTNVLLVAAYVWNASYNAYAGPVNTIPGNGNVRIDASSMMAGRQYVLVVVE